MLFALLRNPENSRALAGGTVCENALVSTLSTLNGANAYAKISERLDPTRGVAAFERGPRFVVQVQSGREMSQESLLLK